MDEDSKECSNHGNIQDAIWKNAECKSIYEGQIKFRKNKKKELLKNFSKGVCFILVAALSGGVTANYIIRKNFSVDFNENNLKNVDKHIKSKLNVADYNESSITRVAECVRPSVVGVSSKINGNWSDSDGNGSGVIFRKDGYIVTNKNIVGNSKEMKVKLNNDKELDAKVIGVDSRTDLAVIKVESQNLPAVKFGDSSKIKVGEVAIGIGNNLGEQFSGTVTSGIISSLNKRIDMIDKATDEKTVYKVIQTDASINKGNSGGALCNINGEVIGINILKVNSKNCIQGVGFAIGINEAKSIINSLMEYGKVSRVALGILYGGTAIPQTKDATAGVYVQEVIRDSGASKAGIRPTDIIVKLDNNNVKTMDDISIVLEKYKVGQKINCTLWRNGQIQHVKVTLSEHKNN